MCNEFKAECVSRFFLQRQKTSSKSSGFSQARFRVVIHVIESYTEMVLFGIVALMLFGSKLPDVARGFGRNYRELRRKVDDLQREFRDWDKPDYPPASNKGLLPYDDTHEDKVAPSAPKFVPPSEDDESDSTSVQ